MNAALRDLLTDWKATHPASVTPSLPATKFVEKEYARIAAGPLKQYIPMGHGYVAPASNYPVGYWLNLQNCWRFLSDKTLKTDHETNAVRQANGDKRRRSPATQAA